MLVVGECARSGSTSSNRKAKNGEASGIGWAACPGAPARCVSRVASLWCAVLWMTSFVSMGMGGAFASGGRIYQAACMGVAMGALCVMDGKIGLAGCAYDEVEE